MVANKFGWKADRTPKAKQVYASINHDTSKMKNLMKTQEMTSKIRINNFSTSVN